MRTTQRLSTQVPSSIVSLKYQPLLVPSLWEIKKSILTPDGLKKFAQLAIMEHDSVLVTYNLESIPLTSEVLLWSIAVTLSSPQSNLNRYQVRFETLDDQGLWTSLYATPLLELSKPRGEGLVYSLQANLETSLLKEISSEKDLRFSVSLSHSSSQVLTSSWEGLKIQDLPLQEGAPFTKVVLEGNEQEYELTYAPSSESKVTYLGCNMVIDSNLKLYSPQGVISTKSFSYPCGLFDRGPLVQFTEREASGSRGFKFSPLVSGYLTGVSLYRGSSQRGKVTIELHYQGEDPSSEFMGSLEYEGVVSESQWVEIPLPEALGLEAGGLYTLTYKDDSSKVMIGRGKVLEETCPLEYLGTIEGSRFSPKGTSPVNSSYGIDLIFDLDNIYQPLKEGKKGGAYGTQLIPRCITLTTNFEARLEVRHQSIWGTWQTYDPLAKIITLGGKRVKTRTDEVLKWSLGLEVEVMAYEKAFTYRILSEDGIEFAKGEGKLLPEESLLRISGETPLEPTRNLKRIFLEVQEPRYEIDLATGKATRTETIKTHRMDFDLERIEVPEEVAISYNLEASEEIEIDDIDSSPPLDGFEYSLTPKREGTLPLEVLGHFILKTRDNVVHNKSKMIL